MYSFPNFEPVHCPMSGSNCCFLTCIQISQEANQVVCYSHLFQNFLQFVVIHTVKGFGIVNKAKVDFFWNSCAFSVIQQMLATWSLVLLPFLNVHILLKLSLKDFENDLAGMWNESNCIVVWTVFLPFFGIGMKTDIFLPLWPLLSFPNLLACWVQYFNSSIF